MQFYLSRLIPRPIKFPGADLEGACGACAPPPPPPPPKIRKAYVIQR